MYDFKVAGWDRASDNLAIQLRYNKKTYYLLSIFIPHTSPWHEDSYKDFFDAYVERRKQCLT